MAVPEMRGPMMLMRSGGFPATLLPSGPVAGMPPGEEPPRRRLRDRLRDLDGDAVLRIVAAAAVLSVAAIAAVVSYSHIYDLARAHGESGTAARLLPVSVDGLIASASLALLHAARKRLRAPWMAYLMLWLGVGATIAANVAFGLGYGWMAAVIAAWPAIAFVGSVEMALMLARNERRADDGGMAGGAGRWPWRSLAARHPAPAAAPLAAVVAAPEAAPDGPPSVPEAEPPCDPPAALAAVPSRPRDRQPRSRQPQPRRKPRAVPPAADSAAAKSARADAELAANPGRTNAEIAAACGVSERTVERRRQAAREAGAVPAATGDHA